ncbi:MAG: glycosyltransferase [Enterococcus sp.]|uniref:glycosyltransferase n=1 Tax=Methanothrix sp. TaxID=90426 RepID=UPI00169A9FB4|nr:glycosyltransferase [Enterococcus sp.]
MERGSSIWIGSFQFSPIYKSHCCALGNQLEKLGFSVRYLFSKEYDWMLTDHQKKNTIFIGNSTDILSAIRDGFDLRNVAILREKIISERPDYIYMYNFHPFLNYYLAKLAQRNKIKYIYHMQEPYAENKKIYGGASQYWLHTFEFFQEKLVNNVNTVVLSSNVARNLFKKRYKKFKRNVIFIPLMYEDLGHNDRNEKRRYITFIGPPVPSKSPETFLKIIDNTQDLDLDYLLITRKPVRDKKYIKKNLEIYFKERISDYEIGDNLSRSIMTIAPYKVSTQSSVILTSFMYGTPVLSTNVGGISEVASHGKTGYLVNLGSSVSEWIAGLKFILSNQTIMSQNCRQEFINNFSEANWKNYLDYL